MRDLDGQVVRDDSPLNDLLQHFVCVRFPRMRGVDLEQFQFDFDLSMAIFFVAPDGTVLGRFCARTGADKGLNNLPALRKATRRALDIYEKLDEERPNLLAKKRRMPVKRVEDIDYGEIQKVVEEGQTDRGNCVHCHNVHEGLNMLLERGRDYSPDQVRSRYPEPRQVGFVVDPEDGLRLREVLPNSAAARAGIEVGDKINRLAGQPLVSVADLIWALGDVPDPGNCEVVVSRQGKDVRFKLELERGWKPADLWWRTSLYMLRPRVRLAVEALGARERRRLDLQPGEMAILAGGVYGDEVYDAGLRNGDVILAVGDMKDDLSPSRFHAYLRQHYWQKAAVIPLTVFRDGKKLEIKVQM